MPALLLPLLGAALIGVTLGLLGSGGSIFTVPVLHYGLGWSAKQSVAGSLFVVGAISLIALLPRLTSHGVLWRTALGFGLPGLLGTFLGAYASRWIPGEVQMLVFACVLGAAAFFMARPAPAAESERAPRAAWKLGLDGFGVGTITGLVGVGGGFMIVPALVLLSGLDIHLAVGTSLLIIVANSSVGLYEHLRLLAERQIPLDWSVLWLIVGVGGLGSLLGGQLARHIPRRLLQRGFAFVLAAMAMVILGLQVHAHLTHPTPSQAPLLSPEAQDPTELPVNSRGSALHADCYPESAAPMG
jgi:uncharacterized protein